MGKDENNDARTLALADDTPKVGLSLEAVARCFDVSTKTITRRVKANDFPKPYKIGSQSRWDIDVLKRWSAQRSAAANGEAHEGPGLHDSETDSTVPTTQGGDSAGSGSVEAPKSKRAGRRSNEKPVPPHPPLQC